MTKPQLPERNHQHGFTLIEILLALAIFAMLASALAPGIVVRAQLRGAETLAREIFELQNAAKAYYVDRSGWPGSIGDLASAGYLPTGWDGTMNTLSPGPGTAGAYLQ